VAEDGGGGGVVVVVAWWWRTMWREGHGFTSQSRSADRRSGRSPTQSTTASSPSWFDNAEAMPSSERLRI